MTFLKYNIVDSLCSRFIAPPPPLRRRLVEANWGVTWDMRSRETKGLAQRLFKHRRLVESGFSVWG